MDGSPQRKLPACGNPNCSVSTGIHDGLTYGRGRLDRHGFWEIPCRICAAQADIKYPKEAPAWPFE